MGRYFVDSRNFLKLFFFLFIFSLSSESFAQNEDYWLINGIVTDNNSVAIPFANVYINNTSIGTNTTEAGFFSLKVPKSFPKIELAVSSIGYSSIKQVLSNTEMSKRIRVKLEASMTVLKEAEIVAHRDRSWNRKLRIFKRALYGNSNFTNHCEILNTEVLSLTYAKDHKLMASVNQPLIVQNNALGYKIRYDLTYFSSDGYSTYYAGDKYFEELKPKDQKQENQWKKNRNNAYKNSFRNFLVALRKNELSKNGFEIFGLPFPKNYFYRGTSVANEVNLNRIFPLTAQALCAYDSIKQVYVLRSDIPILVFLTKHFSGFPVYSDYPYDFSQIILPYKFATFSENGWLIQPNKMGLMNFWGNEGFSTMLPIDYIQVENTIIDHKSESEFWELKSQVLSQNQKPIQGANIYINQSSIKTQSDSAGSFYFKIPNQFQKLKLFVESPGFKIGKKDFYANDDDVIQLNEKFENSKTTNLNNNSKELEKKLLGNSSLAKNCEILNPEVLTEVQTMDNKWISNSTKPILIQNDALGYKIKVFIDSLKVNETDNQFYGNSSFEILEAKDVNQKADWEKNQKRVFQTSFRNFVYALEQDKLKENGFEIYKVLKLKKEYLSNATLTTAIADSSIRKCDAKEIMKYDEQNKRYFLFSDTPLLVFLKKLTRAIPLFSDYRYEFSLIDFKNTTAIFSENGEIIEKNDMVLRNYWGNIGFANILPIDYAPSNSLEKIETTKAEMQYVNTDTLNLANIIKTSGINYVAADIKVEETSKSFGIVNADYLVKISDVDKANTVYDLLRRLPGLMVVVDPENFGYKIFFRENLTPKGSGSSQDVTPALYLDGILYADANSVYSILSSLNVANIEKIGVVKYGSGAAFGARGGNGTILINTKK